MKKKSFFVGLVSAVVLAATVVVGVSTKDKASAASKGYFNEYNKLATIEHGDGYCGIQGMSVYGDWAYYAKVQYFTNSGFTGNGGIWAYNLKTGQKIKAYEGSTNNAVLNIGHANCLFVNSNNIYIAGANNEGDSNVPSIVKYNIQNTGDRVNLTNRTEYKLYSGNNKTGRVIVGSGVEYAGSMGGFLVKSGTNIYYGNFADGYFNWTKKFSLDQYVTCNNETINLDYDTCFTYQSIYYKDGVLYLPLHSKKHAQQSVVVGFNLTSATPNGATLPAVDESLVRITSNNAYPNLFEAEAVSCYNGKMIMAVNGRKAGNVAEDTLVEIKGFNF